MANGRSRSLSRETSGGWLLRQPLSYTDHPNARRLVMEELTRKAEHRILALTATNELQEAVGFEDKWKGLVENSIYKLIEDGYRRGHQYPTTP